MPLRNRSYETQLQFLTGLVLMLALVGEVCRQLWHHCFFIAVCCLLVSCGTNKKQTLPAVYHVQLLLDNTGHYLQIRGESGLFRFREALDRSRLLVDQLSVQQLQR